MSERLQSIRRVLSQQRKEMYGYIVSWDVDSRDMALGSRLRRFVFGHDVRRNGRKYHYPGIVESDGTLYLGQSVLFVTEQVFPAMKEFLTSNGIVHDVMRARIGRGLPNQAKTAIASGKD